MNRHGLEGLAMELFDEGTATLSAQQISPEAGERLGASISVGGGDDRSSFTLSALSANLAPSLDLMRQIIREPAFKPEDLERVRNQTITGIRQAMKSPQGIAQRTLAPELFGTTSPYGGVSTVESVGAITRDDLIAFKDSWIRPDNGEVFVISDRPLAEIVAQLNAVFGDWQAPATLRGEKSFAIEASSQGNRIILVNRPNSPQSIILGAQITPLDAGRSGLCCLQQREQLARRQFSRAAQHEFARDQRLELWRSRRHPAARECGGLCHFRRRAG